MLEKNGIVGGLVAENSKSGIIENCYCLTSLKVKNMMAGGFVGKNTGKISTSYCSHLSKGLTGGFSGDGKQTTDKCYFVIKDEDEHDKSITSFHDGKLAKLTSEMKKEGMIKAFGFDLDQTWEIADGKTSLMFKDSNWYYDIPESCVKDREAISIKTADDLFTFSQKVNAGDKVAKTAFVKLENDIDLKGKKWTPIGADRANGFEGIFEGNGFNISGLMIKDDSSSKKGFFGYLLGEVYNIEIDCMVKGDGTIGGIAAVNEGVIGCCGVTIQLAGKGSDFEMGGLVGINEGRIFKSFSAGCLKKAGIPILPLLILLSAVLIAAVLVVWVSKLSFNRGYKNVPSDPDQSRYQDDILEETETTEAATVLSFKFMEYISIDRESGKCTLDFQNPAETNCKIIIRLVMDEEAAKEAFEENSWNNEYYDPTSKQVVIAESGAVEPGYQLENLYLNEIARSHLHTGEYTGSIILVPYDEETEDLKQIEAALPVTVRIE